MSDQDTKLSMLMADNGIRNHLPLADVTVIDLSHVYSGPYATFLMAMAGAAVIKVEPLGGESLRNRDQRGGAAMPYAMLNSNKLAVTLNLKAPEGISILKDMVRRADVLVENFTPGVTDRLGVGSDVLRALNPRLIYASISGYGRTGPSQKFPAMDLAMQAMSGIMSLTGYPDLPPVKAAPAICDFSAGAHLYAAIVTALYERERTGLGRVVDVAMQDTSYFPLASNLGMLHARGPAAANRRTGNHHGSLGIAPYNAYAALDGYIVITGPSDRHFRAILDVIGRPDLQSDPRFATRTARVDNMAAVDQLLEAWTKVHSRDEIVEALLQASVPCAPVRDLSEVVLDENMHARGTLQWFDHPDLGRAVMPHSPISFQGGTAVAVAGERCSRRRQPQRLCRLAGLFRRPVRGTDRGRRDLTPRLRCNQSQNNLLGAL